MTNKPNHNDDNSPEQSEPPSADASADAARYRLIYDDLSSYCDKVWNNILELRGNAKEHSILSAMLLGLHLAFNAAADYNIGWLGLTGILLVFAVTLPHLRLVVSTVSVPDFHLKLQHSKDPSGEVGRLIIAAKEARANALDELFETILRRYRLARNSWFVGTITNILLVLIEYLL